MRSKKAIGNAPGDPDMIENNNCDICGHFGPVSVKEMKIYFGEVPVVHICSGCAVDVLRDFDPSLQMVFNKEAMACTENEQKK